MSALKPEIFFVRNSLTKKGFFLQDLENLIHVRSLAWIPNNFFPLFYLISLLWMECGKFAKEESF